MNKTELITLLRDPSKLSSGDLDDLEEIVDQYPYFLSARLLLAKGSKELKDPKTKKRVASAAVYSTDRILLKKYLSGNLFFLSQPPPAATEEAPKPKQPESKAPVEKPAPTPAKSQPAAPPKEAKSEQKVEKVDSKAPPRPREDKRPSALRPVEKKPSPEVPDVPAGNLDSILDELKKDMKNLKESREHFVEVQQKIEEDDAVSAALEKASQKPEAPTSNEEKTQEVDTPNDKKEEATPAASSSEEVEEIANDEKAEKEDTSQDQEDSTDADSSKSDPSEDEIIAQKIAEIAGDSSKKPKGEDASTSNEDTKEETKEETSDDTDDSNMRAERSIREPRFSRFSTRSYLKNLDPEDLPPSPESTEKEESPKEEKKTPKARKTTKKTKEESKEEKPKKATKKSTSTSTAKAKTTKEDKKSSTTKATAKKSTTKKKTTTSKSTTSKTAAKKTTAKKTTAKKTTPKKAAATKKTTAKKTSTAKSTSKTKSTKKADDKKDDGKGERDRQQQIIDKFIKEAPTIKYQRDKDQSAIDLAENSGAWDPNLASEYLAEIYLHQGNKKRAIEIYEALSLKYPEKKSYFADLISKIE